jgi:hypothetical protein
VIPSLELLGNKKNTMREAPKLEPKEGEEVEMA